MHELLQRWWRGETPLGAVLLAIIMAVLRIVYMGGGWKRMLPEGLLCGALTLSFASALKYLNWPKPLPVAISGGIGFIGADALCTDMQRDFFVRANFHHPHYHG